MTPGDWKYLKNLDLACHKAITKYLNKWGEPYHHNSRLMNTVLSVAHLCYKTYYDDYYLIKVRFFCIEARLCQGI